MTQKSKILLQAIVERNQPSPFKYGVAGGLRAFEYTSSPENWKRMAAARFLLLKKEIEGGYIMQQPKGYIARALESISKSRRHAALVAGCQKEERA